MFTAGVGAFGQMQHVQRIRPPARVGLVRPSEGLLATLACSGIPGGERAPAPAFGERTLSCSLRWEENPPGLKPLAGPRSDPNECTHPIEA